MTKPPNELVTHIWKLRDDEGIPIHFRRVWLHNNKLVWYVWYGYTLIAYRNSQKTAHRAVDIAAAVHRSIHESNKIKAA